MFGGKIGQNRSAGNAWCGSIVIAIDIVHIFALQLSSPSTSSQLNDRPAHVLGQNRSAASAWFGGIVIAIDIVHIFALQLSSPSTSSLSNDHPAHVLEGKIRVQAMHGAVVPVRNVRHCLTRTESSGQFFVILI